MKPITREGTTKLNIFWSTQTFLKNISSRKGSVVRLLHGCCRIESTVDDVQKSPPPSLKWTESFRMYINIKICVAQKICSSMLWDHIKKCLFGISFKYDWNLSECVKYDVKMIITDRVSRARKQKFLRFVLVNISISRHIHEAKTKLLLLSRLKIQNYIQFCINMKFESNDLGLKFKELRFD